MTLRASIYTRVSSVGQAADDKVSLSQQEADCRAYCETKGYEVVSLYSDVASGATKRRPDFQRLLRDVREGAVDVVVAWSSDRLTRSIFSTSALMEALDGTDARVECAREAVDLNTLALHAAVGQIELNRIRERTTMGKRGAAKAGRLPHGRGVYGYRVGSDGKPEADPDEGTVVQRIFEEYAGGRSTEEIATGLDADGILPRRGGRWNPAYLGMRLRDPVYVGQGYYGKQRYQRTETGVRVKKYDREQWIEIPHPPLVDEALFATVAQRRKSRRSRDYPKAPTRQFLLQGLLRCAACDKGFVCRSHTKYSGRYYECFGTFRLKTGCRKNPQIINAKLLEEVVWSTVVEWVTRPDLLEEAVRSQVTALRERGAYADLEEMRRSLEALTAEEDRVIALCSRGKITEAQLERQLRRFTERREHYQERITVLEAEAREADRQLARVEDFRRGCEEIAARIDDLTFEERRQVVKAVVESVTVDGDNNLRIDLAVYPERLPTPERDVATVDIGTLWPEMAIRCEVPVAFRSSVRSGGMAERWPRKMPWANAACGSGRARPRASPSSRRTSCSAAGARSPRPLAMVSTSG